MPKLKTIDLRVQNDAGEKLQKQFQVNVDAHGKFYINFEEGDPFIEVVRQASRDIGDSSNLYVPRWKAPIRAETGTLRSLEKWMIKAMDLLIATTKTSELVIVYGHASEFSAWLRSDGQLTYSGEDREREDDPGWTNGTRSFHAGVRCRMFTVGIIARVFERCVYKRGDTEKVTYDYISSKDLGAYGYRLNSMITEIQDRDISDHKQMPYTEKNAEFFYTVMLQLANSAMNIHRFMNDEIAVMRQIESGQQGIPKLGHIKDGEFDA